MSKANNRKEIKAKEELQARFQIGISQANSTVLSWLQSSSTPKSLSTSTTEDTALFLSLPVIPAGSGLSLATTDLANNTDSNDIHTIGDFINSDKKISTLSKKKRGNTLNDRINRINDRHKINKNDSKATIALKNKMRNSNRNEIRKINDAHKNLRTGGAGAGQKNIRRIDKQSQNSEIGGARQAAGTSMSNDDDEDDEQDTMTRRSVKKGSNLLFDTRSKRK